MNDDKYKMNIFLILISILITIGIIGSIYFCYDRYINFDEYYKEEAKEEQKEKIDISDPQVAIINPFSGDFSNSSLLYLTKIKTMKRSELTNDFVLKMAFSKVTYQDLNINLNEQYNEESDFRFTLKADVLEQAIGSVFGSLNYYKSDFNTLDLNLMNSDKTVSDSFLYTIKYNKRKDEYSVSFNDIEELVKIENKELIDSNVIPLYQEAIKYEDRIELDIYPIFIKKQGNLSDEDSAYICYKSFDYEEKKFKGKISDTIYVKNKQDLSLTDLINSRLNGENEDQNDDNDLLNKNSKNELDKAIEKIDKTELIKYRFTYIKDESEAFVFDSFEILE